jgi:hypothetical protein
MFQNWGKPIAFHNSYFVTFVFSAVHGKQAPTLQGACLFIPLLTSSAFIFIVHSIPHIAPRVRDTTSLLFELVPHLVSYYRYTDYITVSITIICEQNVYTFIQLI